MYYNKNGHVRIIQRLMHTELMEKKLYRGSRKAVYHNDGSPILCSPMIFRSVDGFGDIIKDVLTSIGSTKAYFIDII